MPITVPDGGIHMQSQGMEEIHYNEDFKQEDGCVSMDPETLETFIQGISQCLIQPGSEQILNQILLNPDFNFSFEGTDTNSNVNQTMINMASINDAHFSQMVNENQAYPADLENIEGLIFAPVKSENDLDHWKPLWTFFVFDYWDFGHTVAVDYKIISDQEKTKSNLLLTAKPVQLALWLPVW